MYRDSNGAMDKMSYQLRTDFYEGRLSRATVEEHLRDMARFVERAERLLDTI